MIQPQTYLSVADNSGARKLMCIQILGNNRQYANIGDIIVAVVKDAIPNMPLKKSDVVRAVIVRTRKGLRRENGMSIRFDDDVVALYLNDPLPTVSSGAAGVQPIPTLPSEAIASGCAEPL